MYVCMCVFCVNNIHNIQTKHYIVSKKTMHAKSFNLIILFQLDSYVASHKEVIIDYELRTRKDKVVAYFWVLLRIVCMNLKIQCLSNINKEQCTILLELKIHLDTFKLYC